MEVKELEKLIKYLIQEHIDNAFNSAQEEIDSLEYIKIKQEELEYMKDTITFSKEEVRKILKTLDDQRKENIKLEKLIEDMLKEMSKNGTR